MRKTITLGSLRKFNLIMAGLHAVQGLAIVLISKSLSVPITGNYLRFNETTQHLEPASRTLFNVQLPWLIAIFFFLSALAHLIIATFYNKRYNKNLRLGINKVRWIEYALSASIMMVAISILVGMYDLCSLLMVVGLISTMNLLGLAMEVCNQNAKKPSWITYLIGCWAGVIPWVVVAFYIWLSSHEGNGPPTFVYWIFASIFTFFSCFAVNMFLQYKKIGPWKNYLYGERAYIILSLVAKSLLAWQVFAGTLRP